MAQFDPYEHKQQLSPVRRDYRRRRPHGQAPVPAPARIPAGRRGVFSKHKLIHAYRTFLRDGVLQAPDVDLVEKIRLKPTRTLSGVTPVTVLTRPYPCPGRCIFCPTDVRMPKSYLRDEPGAQRAEGNGFDPYMQTYARLNQYWKIGHPTDKVEVIILGGTWSAYPRPYQRWFIKRVFDALNDFGAVRRGQQRVAPVYEADGRADWREVLEAHARNETADSRCVGLVVETRPDHITPRELARLRWAGLHEGAGRVPEPR
ncbi:MAG: hypothetical protein M5R40_22590 [Anaerolineae bacterium]|nr:hypothetical protein [Anaerolineae bacterium]